MMIFAKNLFLSLATLAMGSLVQASDADIKKEIQDLCPAYSFAREASLSIFNPPAKVENGVALPGTKQTLFRGVYEANPQFDYRSVILGLFGQDNWVLGSPMHWGITEVLTGARGHHNSFLPSGGLPLTMGDYFDARSIKDDIDLLISCKRSKPYSKAQANFLAKDLMNKSFAHMKRADLEKTYFNIKDSDYYSSSLGQYGFGNNAVDFVISSYNDQIASLYGNKILIFKDKKNRSVDLGYWNLVNNGLSWTDWVDNGEINTPGYITASDLIGYQQRQNDRSPLGWGGSEANNPIIFGLYKMNYKGVDVVAVVSGANELCMVQDEQTQKISFCKNNWSGKIMTELVPAPVSRGSGYKNRAPLLGVIVKCNTSCSVPDGFFEWYGNTQPADISLESEISQLKVNGKSLKYIKASVVAPPADSLPGTIKVVSATYVTDIEKAAGTKDNVTAPAAAFCDGKQSVLYKVSSRFLGLTDPTKSRSFVMSYTCSNKPKQILQKKINAPAEFKTFAIDCNED